MRWEFLMLSDMWCVAVYVVVRAPKSFQFYVTFFGLGVSEWQRPLFISLSVMLFE